MNFKTLHNGIKMPAVAFGTINTTKEAVKAAIKAGYRNIDTAEIYGNEEMVGQAIREAIDEYGIKREELFISTKLWKDFKSHDFALSHYEASKKRLGLDYIDLYLIHWPANATKNPSDWQKINLDTWSGLEELYTSGAVKAIGVSNYLSHHIESLIAGAKIKPMVNQIEYHPGFAQTESADLCKKNGIAVEAWSPFGTGEVLKNETLLKIAESHGKTSAQIALRWLLQKDIIPVAKSSNEKRISENLAIFNFELTEDEMSKIDSLPYIGGMGFDPDTESSKWGMRF